MDEALGILAVLRAAELQRVGSQRRTPLPLPPDMAMMLTGGSEPDNRTNIENDHEEGVKKRALIPWLKVFHECGELVGSNSPRFAEP